MRHAQAVELCHVTCAARASSPSPTYPCNRTPWRSSRATSSHSCFARSSERRRVHASGARSGRRPGAQVESAAPGRNQRSAAARSRRRSLSSWACEHNSPDGAGEQRLLWDCCPAGPRDPGQCRDERETPFLRCPTLGRSLTPGQRVGCRVSPRRRAAASGGGALVARLGRLKVAGPPWLVLIRIAGRRRWGSGSRGGPGG
jgi:hypothetical protein